MKSIIKLISQQIVNVAPASFEYDVARQRLLAKLIGYAFGLGYAKLQSVTNQDKGCPVIGMGVLCGGRS
jgi:hypothetical protein